MHHQCTKSDLPAYLVGGVVGFVAGFVLLYNEYRGVNNCAIDPFLSSVNNGDNPHSTEIVISIICSVNSFNQAKLGDHHYMISSNSNIF